VITGVGVQVWIVGVFHTQGTSQRGGCTPTAEAAWTGGVATIAEAVLTEDPPFKYNFIPVAFSRGRVDAKQGIDPAFCVLYLSFTNRRPSFTPFLHEGP
jgi:hypothetical protein